MSQSWLITGPAGSGRSVVGTGVRRRAAVRDAVPAAATAPAARRCSRRRARRSRHRLPRRPVDRHRRRQGAGPQGLHPADRRPLANHDRRGRRPVHRRGREHLPEDARGAARAHGHPAVRAVAGRHAAHDRVALPEGAPAAALERRPHPRAGRRGHRSGHRRVRRPRRPRAISDALAGWPPTRRPAPAAPTCSGCRPGSDGVADALAAAADLYEAAVEESGASFADRDIAELASLEAVLSGGRAGSKPSAGARPPARSRCAAPRGGQGPAEAPEIADQPGNP